MDGKVSPVQLIYKDGKFNDAGVEKFVKEIKLAERGLSYRTVSIMGPQSSGKSTLMNRLFKTDFKEMDALKGRSQTTQGIWMHRGVGIEPLTIVIDIEGCDGDARGEDDTFEKQSALFALAVSDIVIINMWCKDIGRQHASNKPLLKTVFEVMARLFSPRKTTLLFVIRDQTKTPLELLEGPLRKDVQRIWDDVPKPEDRRDVPLSEFFNVEVRALPSYEEKEEQFLEQVANLREIFHQTIKPHDLAGDPYGVVPASAFSVSVKGIWGIIKENKDLNLPAQKVIVARLRCDDIAKEKLSNVTSKDWIKLDKAIRRGIVPGFGKQLGAILEQCLSEYDKEAFYFEEGVRTSRRKQLESELFQRLYPAYEAMLRNLCTKSLHSFKGAFQKALERGEEVVDASFRCRMDVLSEFDKGCKDASMKQANWDPSKVRIELESEIGAEIMSVHVTKLSEEAEKNEEALHNLQEALHNLRRERNIGYIAGGVQTGVSIVVGIVSAIFGVPFFPSTSGSS